MAVITRRRGPAGSHETARITSKAPVLRLPPPRQMRMAVAVKDEGHASRQGKQAARPTWTSPGGSTGPEIIEHRQGRRRRVLALVDLLWRDGRRCGGLMHDIGPEGMYVLCTVAPADARCVEVMPAAATPVSIPGFVVHRRSNGIGLMFRDMDDTALAFVRRCLRQSIHN